VPLRVEDTFLKLLLYPILPRVKDNIFYSIVILGETENLLRFVKFAWHGFIPSSGEAVESVVAGRGLCVMLIGYTPSFSFHGEGIARGRRLHCVETSSHLVILSGAKNLRTLLAA